MKKYVLSSAVAAAIFAMCFAWGCFTSSPGSAQPPATPMGALGPQPFVALVDVNYILKNHVRLAAQRKELTTEADKLQKEYEEQGRALQERAKQLGPNGFKPGTESYNQLEEQLSKEQSAIKTAIQQKRREFALRESHMMYTAYTEINQEVRAYCEARGIAMALNFNHEAMRDDNPDSVVRALSNPVVYHVRDLDITPNILPRFIKPVVADGNVAPFNPQINR